ncbi:MAG: glycoside hydrolase family 127 protein [Bacteroidales bacterium]|nr:glycoside hydrolase family 127 protein [Bacteroidales bacterium]
MKTIARYTCCLVILVGWLGCTEAFAQRTGRETARSEPFYPARFAIDQVTLLDGPFLRAQQLNYRTMMEYDVDRLLTPYVRQSGLAATRDSKSPYYQWEHEHPAFTSFAWNPALAMDGHMLGHYLSALSLACSSCHDPVQQSQMRERVDYIIRVLDDCQRMYDSNKDGMKGFLGGIPDNGIWTSLLESDYRVYNQRGHWTPFYCQHKIAAGLRDAYLYAGNQTARDMYRKMCDWFISVVSMFREDVMEMQILQWEPGAVNEVLADAYAMFDNSDYLKAAQKFSHQILIENINNDERHVFLDKKHTNHFAAMFEGIGRINQLKRDTRYGRGALRYWEEFVQRRMSVIGGAGVGGHFVSATKPEALMQDADGPDLCTTCNMLKLTETLFADAPQARYAEYYERAVLNHVLADMDPATGGFAFFTPMRPESYRIYGKVNEAMWCCAGSGMEAQSRYGEFIYSYCQDTLYVNLFIDSKLESNVATLEQYAKFPFGQSSCITIRKSGAFKLAVRHPSWATEGFQVKVNGRPLNLKPDQCRVGRPNYIYCGKNWHKGDVIEVVYPMRMQTEACPGVSDRIALLYGPMVLAAQTTDTDPEGRRYEKLMHEYGGDGMHDFSPQTVEKFPSASLSPMLICEPEEVFDRVVLVDPIRMLFKANVSAPGSLWTDVLVRPFFDLHHARYMLYWNNQTRDAWLRSPLYDKQIKLLEADAMTFDEVTPGQAASETEHHLRISETGSRGSLNGKPFRDAQPNEWFEYTLRARQASESMAHGVKIVLTVRFSVIDKGRSCLISVNDEPVTIYTVSSRDFDQDKFFEKQFLLSPRHLRDASDGVVRISSVEGSLAPRCFNIKLMRGAEY